MPSSDDDEYTVPLQDQRVFGSGIRRKKINFVPASAASEPAATSSSAAPGVGDRYLALVLGRTSAPPLDASSTAPTGSSSDAEAPTAAATATATATAASSVADPALCPVCKLPLPSAPDPSSSSSPAPRHESSLAHQACEAHSHPPSHLDRARPGYRYLQAYGWDADARRGLGREGEGRRDPVKAVVKRDTEGVGAKQEREDLIEKRRDRERLGKRGKVPEKEKKVEKLDAGKVRKRDAEDRKKGERLREMFYGREEVTRYLYGET